MTDVFSDSTRPADAVRAAADGREDLVALVELVFFAYRDWTAEPDQILEVYGLGRAHHRVLHFINQRPGLRISDLLEVLKITKQSLNRVLKPLYSDGWLEARAGLDDRRERNLYLTPKGTDLAQRLIDLQTKRMAEILALATATSDAFAQPEPGTSSARHAVAFLMAMRTARATP